MRTATGIEGLCTPEFSNVRDAFENNFVERDEIGAAVAVWVDGDLAVHLWGARPTPPAFTPGMKTPSRASSPAQKP